MGKKVLLVDDDESHSILSRLLLERMHYEVTVCSSGDQALRIFTATPEEFYFVATDYTMEPMDGLSLARKLREVNPSVVILLLTGYDHPEILAEARQAGVRAVSLKPSSVDEFEDVIESMHL